MKRDLKLLDPYFNYAPWIWGVNKECNQTPFNYVIKDSPFFDGFEAIDTIMYTNEELRTISWLSSRHIKRIAYNPKNIDYYFQSLGLLGYDESSFDIICQGINCPCSIDQDITFSEWHTLPDGRTPELWSQEEKGKIERELYLDRLDIPHEYQEGEAPMK